MNAGRAIWAKVLHRHQHFALRDQFNKMFVRDEPRARLLRVQRRVLQGFDPVEQVGAKRLFKRVRPMSTQRLDPFDARHAKP